MGVYLVGTDGSETARSAAERAAALARASGASVHVVCAYHRGGTVISSGASGYTESSLAAAADIAEQLASRLRSGGLEATTSVAEGKPADVLLDTARELDAELIVVGNRRMQGFSRVLGAIANEIVHRAPCDVLLVKTT